MVTVDWQMVGEKIHIIRRRVGLSQAELAQSAGLSRNFISMLERGKTDPSVCNFLSVCEALGVFPDALLEEWSGTPLYYVPPLLLGSDR